MNTALVLFNGVWIWMNEILSLVGPTRALALESSWYHFCNEKSQNGFFMLSSDSVPSGDPFITTVQRWQFRKGHDYDTTCCLQRLCWMFWHNLSFILTWKMYQTNLKLWSCSPKLSWSLRFCSIFNIGSQLAKDDNVVWIWTVVPHLVCMCGGLWISLQLICIGADITVFSLLLQLTEDDDFIGVRTVVPHVVTTDPVLLLSSKRCISVYPSVQSCPKMTIS